MRRVLHMVALVLLVAAPARAQWQRVTALPVTFVYSLHATGDTIVAGTDSAAWISVNGGQTWSVTTPVGVAPAYVDATWFRDGRLWAGTSGQGVFTSDDRGATWQARSDGLAGGLFDSHLYLQHFVARRDTLYAATGGAGVFARPLRTAGAWQPTGGELVAGQMGGVSELATNGGRLLAAGGFNGQTYVNDGGAPWSPSLLGNGVLLPGLGVTNAVWTGTTWLVGTDHGVYRSATGDEPWTFVGLNVPPADGTRLATQEGVSVAAVSRATGSRVFWTRNDGSTWSVLETVPAFVNDLAWSGSRVWAARSDGLWWRDAATLDAPTRPSAGDVLALRGAHPVAGDRLRLALRLERAALVRLDVLDAQGRRVRNDACELSAGEHEIALDVRGLQPGVYHARATTHDGAMTRRFVRVRG